MQQPMRRSELTIRLLAFGLFAGVALTAGPAHAVSANGPYYAEPAWDQKLPTATRFIILTDWNSEAVLDRETGLVWERVPSNTPPPTLPDRSDWFDARYHCTTRVTGDRKGWRLPSVHELASLMLPSVPPPGAMLPSPGDNPFIIWAPFTYWSATSFSDNPGFIQGRPSGAAWFVDFGTGEINVAYKNTIAQAWCVRGGGSGGELY